MGQLNLKPVSSTLATELAEALHMLQTLPVPPHLPPTLAEAFALAGLQLIVSIAAQYQGQGVGLVALAKAGFEAVARRARADNARAMERGGWSWWMRQGMLAAIAN